MMADAAKKVRVTVMSSIRLTELFSSTPPTIGPIARARLAADCIIPSRDPCSCSAVIFETRLVRDGDAIAFPNDNTVQHAEGQLAPGDRADKWYGEETHRHKKAADTSEHRFTYPSYEESE